MLLDESDIDAIVEHLGNEVQFYDARGRAANDLARREIGAALRSYVGTPSSKAAERFRLVEIAFDRILAYNVGKGDADKIGTRTVELADAGLAAMEPSKPPGPSSLRAVRAELEARHDRDVKRYAETPTDFREGCIDGLAHALKIIDRAMEPEAETNDA